MNSSGVGEKHSRRSSTTSSAATTSSGINNNNNRGQFTGNKVVSPMSSPTSLQSGATPTIAQLQSLLKQQRPLNSSIDDLKSQLQHTNIEFSSFENGGGGDDGGGSESGENIYDDEVIINPDYHSSEDEEEYEEDEDSNSSNNNSVNNINDPNNNSNTSISNAHSCESIAEEEELIASPIQNRHYSFTMGAKDVVIPIGGFASPRTNRSETTVLHHGDESSTKQGALTMGGVMSLNPESEKVLNAKDKISSDYKKMMEDLEGFRSEKLKQRKSKYFSKKDLEEIPFHPSSGTQLRSTLYQQFMNEKIKMIADNPEKYKVELMKCYKENLKPAPKLQSHGSLSNQSDRLKALQRTRSISQPPVVISGGNGGGINKSTIGSLESILEKERKRDGLPVNPITLPILFTKCIGFLSNEDSLKTEGLFRVAGNSSDVEDLLKSILSFGSDIPENCCVHVVSNMLKKFLRQLSTPVFTYKHHNDFIQSMKLNSDQERMKSVKENLKLIPLVNQVLIKELMKFLLKVTEFSSVNMMHAHNLGLMFGPNMLKPPTDSSEMNAISMLDAGNQLITLLIENFNFFYGDESN